MSWDSVFVYMYTGTVQELSYLKALSLNAVGEPGDQLDRTWQQNIRIGTEYTAVLITI
jgi:hypothetical protein